MTIDKKRINDLIEKVNSDMNDPSAQEEMIKIEVSARHLHISQEHLKILFGEEFELTHFKDLSQPDQFATGETIRVAGSRGAISKVRILGPVRPETQIEISMTDTYSLGIKPEIRMSGDIEASPGCVIWGPNGQVILEKGVIVAKRHMHCTPETAERLGLKDADEISIKIDSKRSGVMSGIVVRISDKYNDAIHIDTDEANAYDIKNGTLTRIIK